MKLHQNLNRSSLAGTALLLLLPYLIGCTDNSNPASGTPVDETPAGQFSEMELAAHAKINAYRATKGLAPLSLVSVMTVHARIHSRDMATGGRGLHHDGFQARVIEIQKTVPLQSAAENVAFNTGFDDPADEAVKGWLESPGHRVNIEGDFNVTGIGVERNTAGEYYFTQIFGKR